MARDSALLNLRDMIAIITNLDYQMRFIKLHAPGIKVNWGGLYGIKAEMRAQAIMDALTALKDSSPEMMEQYESLFANLRTVAFINADGDNTATMMSVIKDHDAFARWMDENANPPDTTANLAVFVNLAASGSLNGITKTASAAAKEVWKQIESTATSELLYLKFSPAVQFVPSTATSGERVSGLADFEDELRLHITGKFGQSRPFVAVHTVRTPDYTRYLVTTSPLPRNVPVVNKRKTDTTIEKDNHAKTFEITIDEVHCRAHVSKTSLIGWVEVINMFLRNVLKTAPCETKRLSYSRALQIFRNSKALASLELPGEAADGYKRWIESIDVRLRENLLPVRFRGDEATDVYDQIRQQISVDRFKPDNWVIAEAVIKIALPVLNNRTCSRGGKHRDGGSHVYSMKISEGGCTIRGKDKTFDRDHLKILDELPGKWNFIGETRDQKHLGKKRVALTQGTLDV